MIIVDLDGTLANCEHRKYLINPENYPDLCEYSNYRTKNAIGEDCEPVIDLDGKPSWRFKKTGIPFNKGWKAFFEACDKDIPIFQTIKVLQLLQKNPVTDNVYIWSGRCESVREKTIQWIDKYIDPANYWNWNRRLKMRPVGDYTPDDQLKEKWLNEALAAGKKVDFVIDDRPKVVRMWRRRGIFVFDVNQSGEEF